MRWRGSIEAATDDQRDHPVKVAAHVICGNPKGLDSLLASPAVALLIPNRIVAHVMRNPINFDGQGRRFAEKVEHEGPKGMLPSKLQAVRTLSKDFPKSDLRRTGTSTQLASLIHGHEKNPSTMLRMVPLPGKCRGG